MNARGISGAPPAVSFTVVSRTFGETRALDSVSFNIPIGQTVALLGPNGAGKSTAIGLMLGLLRPTNGTVTTLGLAPREAVATGRVGALLQTVGLPPFARVGELIAFARRLYKAPLALSDLLERTGLGRLSGRRVETLSGGESQRLRAWGNCCPPSTPRTWAGP